MRDKILHWFALGQVGASSKAMACAVAGIPANGAFPHDPADLNRCLLFLEAVPEARNNLGKVALLNDQWACIIARWAEVESCFLTEVGLNWSKGRNLRATKTYALMKEVYKGVE